MTFNGAAPMRNTTTSPGRYAGQDNGWILSLIYPALVAFDQSIMKYPSIKRFPGGASNDLQPNLQNPGESGTGTGSCTYAKNRRWCRLIHIYPENPVYADRPRGGQRIFYLNLFYGHH